MGKLVSEAKINPGEALQLFALGELVVARDMATRLLAADFCVSEDELLDEAGWLRNFGLPVVEMKWTPGTFFCPSAVITFMEHRPWDRAHLLMPPQRVMDQA